MAGMFYSLQEAAEKLHKTEEEIQQIVKDGKLREFRDGPNLLFKVEEVEALMSDTGIMGPEEAIELEPLESEIPETEALASEALEPEIPEEEKLESEIPESDVLESEILEMEASEPEFSAPEVPELEATEPEMPDFEALESEMTESETLESETPAPEAPETEAPVPSEEAANTDEILLAPETGAPVIPSDLTDADTALTGLGTSVLGETDQDYDVTDDTMGETAIPMGTAGTTPEVPLEEIEEDVNLDSFGSGSGLLDLSLQADDTSLGGVLDEIYTAEDEGKELAEADSAEAVAAEAEQMISEEELVATQPSPEVPALAQPFIEATPDAQSNTLGMLLFLPLAIVLYTAVVAVAGLKGVMPSILETMQGLIWYIMAGAAVVSGLVVGASFLLSGERDKSAKKQKKPKKPKVPKKPKEPKKPKKTKKAK